MAGYTEADVRGQRYTGNTDSTLKVRDVQPKITLIQPFRAPFVSLLSHLGSLPTQAAKYEFYEDDLITPTVTTSTSFNSSVTSLTLSTGHAARLAVDTQLYNKTSGEALRVTSIDTSSDTITVTRGEASTTAASIASGENLILASEGREEGIRLGSAITTKATNFYNYIEEFETAVEESWLNMGTRDYTTADFDYQLMKAAPEHKEKMERAFWFGQRNLVSAGSTASKPIYYTGGVDWFISQYAPSANIKSVTGVLTDVLVEDWLEVLFRYGNPDKKMFFTSPFGRMALSRIAKTPVRTVRSEKTLGITITQMELLGHVVPIVENLMFPRIGVNNYIYCLDMDYITMRHLSAQGMNFTTRWMRNVQSPDLKGRKDVLHTIAGLMMKNEFAHGKLYGFTA